MLAAAHAFDVEDEERRVAMAAEPADQSCRCQRRAARDQAIVDDRDLATRQARAFRDHHPFAEFVIRHDAAHHLVTERVDLADVEEAEAVAVGQRPGKPEPADVEAGQHLDSGRNPRGERVDDRARPGRLAGRDGEVRKVHPGSRMVFPGAERNIELVVAVRDLSQMIGHDAPMRIPVPPIRITVADRMTEREGRRMAAHLGRAGPAETSLDLRPAPCDPAATVITDGRDDGHALRHQELRHDEEGLELAGRAQHRLRLPRLPRLRHR